MLAALFGVLALDRRLQSASAASGNTTSVSFFNVGACPSVQAVKFDFSDGSTGGGVNICPEAFRVVGSPRCQVPGPYGREVFVTLSAHVSYLDITILDPSDDDANLTVPTRVYLAAGQQRNLVGASVRTGTAAAACTNGFHVFSEYAAGPIDQRYFRTVFRHAALDAGGADIVSNGESTGELAPRIGASRWRLALPPAVARSASHLASAAAMFPRDHRVRGLVAAPLLWRVSAAMPAASHPSASCLRSRVLSHVSSRVLSCPLASSRVLAPPLQHPRHAAPP